MGQETLVVQNSDSKFSMQHFHSLTTKAFIRHYSTVEPRGTICHYDLGLLGTLRYVDANARQGWTATFQMEQMWCVEPPGETSVDFGKQ